MPSVDAEFFTIAQASARLDGMEPRIIRRYCGNGIVGRKIGRDWMLNESDIAALSGFVARKRGNPNWVKTESPEPKKSRRKR